MVVVVVVVVVMVVVVDLGGWMDDHDVIMLSHTRYTTDTFASMALPGAGAHSTAQRAQRHRRKCIAFIAFQTTTASVVVVVVYIHT